MTRAEVKQLARLGAKARLEELRQEEAAIRKAFPDVVSGGGRAAATKVAARPRRRGMSAAARKAVSARMKKYWAARRKANAAGAKSK